MAGEPEVPAAARVAPRPAASPAPAPPEDRRDVALDALGFAIGLAVSFGLGWQTSDLLWGLWLSSLVVGFTTLVVGVVRAPALAPVRTGSLVAAKIAAVLFFTLHFGLFHFVHSLFLMGLFPPAGVASVSGNVMRYDSLGAVYGAVLRSGWPWLVAAALAERHALVRAWQAALAPGTVTVANNPRQGFDAFGPYRNVIRMHLLIFALLFLAMAGADGAIACVLVQAAWFFPWRLVVPHRAAAQIGSARAAGSTPRTHRNASP